MNETLAVREVVTRLWLVRGTGPEDCLHFGFFTNEEAARDYSAYVERCLPPYLDIDVVECVADKPRRSLLGVYVVAFDGDGRIEEDECEWASWAAPDMDWVKRLLPALRKVDPDPRNVRVVLGFDN